VSDGTSVGNTYYLLIGGGGILVFAPDAQFRS